jgi:hypothetical protein
LNPQPVKRSPHERSDIRDFGSFPYRCAHAGYLLSPTIHSECGLRWSLARQRKGTGSDPENKTVF